MDPQPPQSKSGPQTTDDSGVLTDVFGEKWRPQDLHAWLNRTPEPATIDQRPESEGGPSLVGESGSGRLMFWSLLVGLPLLGAVLLSTLLFCLNLFASGWMGEHFYMTPAKWLEPEEAVTSLRAVLTGPPPDRDGVELSSKAANMYMGWLAEKYSEVTESPNPYTVNPFPTSDQLFEERKLAFDKFIDWQGTEDGERGRKAIERKTFAFNFFVYFAFFAAVGALLLLLRKFTKH